MHTKKFSNSATELNYNLITNDNIIECEKSVDISNAIIGTTLTYSINIVNTSPYNILDVVFIDTIPKGIEFIQNSIIVNGVLMPGQTIEPPLGLILNSLLPYETINIKFHALAISIPSPNPTLNTGIVKYTVEYDNIYINGEVQSNTVPIFINPYIKPVKSVDNEYATIGDILTYTIHWVNLLNVEQNNVVFIDTIPDNTSFIPESIKINGVPKIGVSILPPNGLYLGTLPVGKNFEVSYNVTVDSIPIQNPIQNDMTVLFDYISNQELKTILRESVVSNKAQTTVNLAKIENLKKLVDKEISTIDDDLTYTITFENTGNVNAINVIFKDTIPTGTTFISDSFIVNGIIQKKQTPEYPTGVIIGTIPAGAVTTLSFKVRVDDSLCIQDISNMGTLNYDYIVNPINKRKLIDSIDTNVVKTKIIAAIIDSIKTTNSCNAFIGMQILYSIRLKNTGNTTAYNVRFTDTIPNGTELVPNSVTLNYTKLQDASVSPPTGIIIGDLGIDEVAYLSFKVTVQTLPSQNPILNSGTVNFNYSINPFSDYIINKSSNTNIVETSIDICSYFRKIYQELCVEFKIRYEESRKYVCEAKELEQKSNSLKQTAKKINAQSKIAQEKGIELNKQSAALLELAEFYTKKSLDCYKNIFNSCIENTTCSDDNID